MIVNKTIYFGYGDVAVGSTMSHLIITPIKPPQEVGSDIDMGNVEIMGEPIKFTFKAIKKVNELIDTLDAICPENNTLVFRGYTFDFSKYNEQSIKVIKKHLENIKTNMSLLIAC